MAVNLSRSPFYPAHTSYNNLVSPLRIVSGDILGHDELNDRFGHRREIVVDRGGLLDPVPKDIIDLLPSDPFEMDIGLSTTITAITRWLGDLEPDYGDYMRNNIVDHKEYYGLFAGFSFFWNNAMRFSSVCGSVICHDQHIKDWDIRDLSNGVVNYESESFLNVKSEESVNVYATCYDVIRKDPHEAFILALSYLGTRDLLVVERVCRSLCTTIRTDSFLWRNLYIDQPLNERITDDILVQLTNRAEGNLQSLSLIKCPKITDDGLRRVLEKNPKLTKLCIPWCTRLSIKGILNNLKAFDSSTETVGITHVRIGGFYNLTFDHYEQLKYLLGVQEGEYNPHYYHQANLYLLSDNDRATDVDICTICQNLRLVYDCPAEGCQPKDQCKACIICIPRCAECGLCLHHSEYEETFSLECLCSKCLNQLPRCQMSHEMQAGYFRDPGDSTTCFNG